MYAQWQSPIYLDETVFLYSKPLIYTRWLLPRTHNTEPMSGSIISDPAEFDQCRMGGTALPQPRCT